MKSTSHIIALSALGASTLLALGAAHAAEPAAPASPHTFTGNVGVVSDYLFRGISQTHGKPAIQGGLDYAHAGGFYAGLWGSSISWVSDAQNVSAPTEIDLYAGYKGTIKGDLGFDVGVIAYKYPGSKDVPANLSAKADTAEVYGAISWKWLTAKYSHATSSHFIGWYGGAAGSDTSRGTRGSGYLEFNANYDLGSGWTLVGHLGRQKVKHYEKVGDTNASYTDWKLGVTKDVGVGVVGLSYSDTNSKGTCAGDTGGTNAYCWGVYSAGGPAWSNFRDASKGQVVLNFTKSF